MVQVITGATCKQHKACDWKSEISIVEAVTKHKSLGSLFELKVSMVSVLQTIYFLGTCHITLVQPATFSVTQNSRVKCAQLHDCLQRAVKVQAMLQWQRSQRFSLVSRRFNQDLRDYGQSRRPCFKCVVAESFPIGTNNQMEVPRGVFNRCSTYSLVFTGTMSICTYVCLGFLLFHNMANVSSASRQKSTKTYFCSDSFGCNFGSKQTCFFGNGEQTPAVCGGTEQSLLDRLKAKLGEITQKLPRFQ
ncbi:uncharacterized protein LOC119373315 isoform X2 [Rhipicephalus sanguineus]|uniref:uncharacterized protein LOC119373315 isoform X2 n=1 Tax=Rhipicephalus sanguineus TaxID=34632 RepID=UPI001894F09F|nr:uncharacterized protein LOC119373315 isoform X2 [Rhipicephalus sanguineus]